MIEAASAFSQLTIILFVLKYNYILAKGVIEMESHKELIEGIKRQLIKESILKSYGIKSREFASVAAEVSKSHMYKIWSGEKNLTEKRAIIWATNLGKKIDWIKWELIDNEEN